jgi:L-serine dehydratase
MVLRAYGGDRVLLEQTWCSVGGGFVRRAADVGNDFSAPPPAPPIHPFWDATSLVARAPELGGTMGDVVLANEAGWETRPGEVGEGLDRVWDAFRKCIGRGLERRGELPGGLGVKRRAADMLARVEAKAVEQAYRHIARAQAYAFAVNEENAAGGRVVTAPTNGAAGIVPAVLVEVSERLALSRDRIRNALATAGAIGMLVKTHASISGAEVGCQGEVGTATAMAAAALCQILGGDVKQAEVAAEIAIEHNLGLTCDPIKGLVQAPCIERNAMGVAKAWSAAQLSLHSVVSNVVSLDRVIKVMKRTGDDMRREYKETSEGGLAVSLPEC